MRRLWFAVVLTIVPTAVQAVDFNVTKVAGLDQGNENSSDSSLPVSHGRVSSVQRQCLANWNLNSIPRFARIDQAGYQINCANANVWDVNIIDSFTFWNSSDTWNSLGNGLSGNEVGPWITTVNSTSATTTNNATLRNWIQAHVDDDGPAFQGLVWTASSNRSAYNALNTATLKITWTNRKGGDTDLDGDVDFQDFLTLNANFNGPGEWEDGDFTGNNWVDFADFLILNDNFGE